MKDGRPTDYNPELHPRLVYEACSMGIITDRKISSLLGISTATFHSWKKLHKEFLSQILRGRDEWNVALAENALMVRVKGGRYTETTREPGLVSTGKLIQNPDGEDGEMVPETKPGMVITKTVSKVRAPETHAIEIHLTNRDPKRWKKVSSIKIGGDEDGIPLRHEDVAKREDLKSLSELFMKVVRNRENGTTGD